MRQTSFHVQREEEEHIFTLVSSPDKNINRGRRGNPKDDFSESEALIWQKAVRMALLE